MGLMEKIIGKESAKPADSVAGAATPSALLDGRDRLRHFTDQIAKANAAIAELEEREKRMDGIIKDAAAAHVALHQAIADDGGAALAEYSAGNAPAAAPIAKLIEAKETTAKAAAAARDALPNVQAALANARAQLARLEQKREDEVLAYLKMRADEVAVQHRSIFAALCRTHDQLVGISAALALPGTSGDLLKFHFPIEIPRFARSDMPSVADPNDGHLPVAKYLVSDFTAEQSASDWRRARERLAKDADADLDDLIGPLLNEVEHKL